MIYTHVLMLGFTGMRWLCHESAPDDCFEAVQAMA